MNLIKLKIMRLEAGITQWKMAEQLNMGETKLSRIESGRIKKVSQDLIKKMAEILGQTPEAVKKAIDLDRNSTLKTLKLR